MRDVDKKPIFRPILTYLIISFSLMSVIPAQSYAIFAPSQMSRDSTVSTTSVRDSELVTIQKVLESKVIDQRLKELGLNPNEIRERVNQLTDDEIHYFATQIDSLNAGGDIGGVLISLLVIVILVLVILQLTGHKIIVQ
jgi:hypothetical protein